MNHKFLVLSLIVFTFLVSCKKDNPIDPVKKVQIFRIIPDSAKIGDIISVIGSDFGSSRGSSVLYFNDLQASQYKFWSDTMIKVILPKYSKSGKLWITLNGVKGMTSQFGVKNWGTINGIKSNEVDFKVFTIFQISNIIPESAKINDTVSIIGTRFGSTQNKSLVLFNKTQATDFVIWNDTLIIVKVPIGATSGRITVVVDKISSNEVEFSVKATDPENTLQITKINPYSSKIGDKVTITGTRFGSRQKTDFISFNNIKATEYLNWNETLIMVIVPNEAKSGKVWISVGGNISNEVDIEIISLKPCVTDWANRNLDVEHFRNGDPIPEVRDSATWVNLKTGAWCYYNNDPSLGAIYGKLYNWYAVNDSRGLAPSGWHVSSETDWLKLETCLGGQLVAGGKMKESDTSHWKSPNKGATNETGFTALPGGYRNKNGQFSNLNIFGDWWSSTDQSPTDAWRRAVKNDFGYIERYFNFKGNGLSVRCVKD